MDMFIFDHETKLLKFVSNMKNLKVNCSHVSAGVIFMCDKENSLYFPRLISDYGISTTHLVVISFL